MTKFEHLNKNEAPVAGLGDIVSLRFEDGSLADTYLADENFEEFEVQVDDKEVQCASPRSPLAMAVLGKAVGEVVSYSTPNAFLSGTVEGIKPWKIAEALADEK